MPTCLPVALPVAAAQPKELRDLLSVPFASLAVPAVALASFVGFGCADPKGAFLILLLTSTLMAALWRCASGRSCAEHSVSF